MPHRASQKRLRRRVSGRMSGGAAANNRNRNAGNNHRPKKSLVFCCPTHACKLMCQQCKGKTKTGAQCKRKTCYGKYCYFHVRKMYGVRTKRTRYGKGLFAIKRFEAGDMICPLDGEKIRAAELNKRYPRDAPAVYAIREHNQIEDAACRRGIGAHANARRGVRCNTKFVLFGRGNRRRFWLQATRLIEPGREIFCHYGDDYDFNAHHKTTRRKLVRCCKPRRAR